MIGTDNLTQSYARLPYLFPKNLRNKENDWLLLFNWKINFILYRPLQFQSDNLGRTDVNIWTTHIYKLILPPKIYHIHKSTEKESYSMESWLPIGWREKYSLMSACFCAETWVGTSALLFLDIGHPSFLRARELLSCRDGTKAWREHCRNNLGFLESSQETLSCSYHVLDMLWSRPYTKEAQ